MFHKAACDSQTDGRTDGRTDGQTDRQNYDPEDRASIVASCGKNADQTMMSLCIYFYLPVLYSITLFENNGCMHSAKKKVLINSLLSGRFF